MSENIRRSPLKLDPWTASSLLQKSIRRGEADLALEAAKALYDFRGASVFRRLCIIAVEDIGIGDIGLVQDVARIGTDKKLREVLGADTELISDLCSRMALATKDRTADYLYCAATKLESASLERRELARMPDQFLIKLASDAGSPLIRRAVAALLACTVERGSDLILIFDQVEPLLDAFDVKFLPLHDVVVRLAHARAHPFCLMLPLIWSRWWHFGAGAEILKEDMPSAGLVRGVPLYTFDKHTAAGKRAIRRFASENELIASALRRWVPDHRVADVAQMAVFYADAVPLARRLKWPTGSLLEQTGLFADMTDAGCRFDGVQPILECVRENLPHLNDFRRAELED